MGRERSGGACGSAHTLESVQAPARRGRAGPPRPERAAMQRSELELQARLVALGAQRRGDPARPGDRAGAPASAPSACSRRWREGYRQLEGLVGGPQDHHRGGLLKVGGELSRHSAEQAAPPQASPGSPQTQPAAGPAWASRGHGPEARRARRRAARLHGGARRRARRAAWTWADALAAAVERLRQRAAGRRRRAPPRACSLSAQAAVAQAQPVADRAAGGLGANSGGAAEVVRRDA